MKLPRFLLDRMMRQKLRMNETPVDRFRVRLAHTAEDYAGAFRLVQAAYVATGIEDVLSSPVRITPQHVLPEAYVLIAEEGKQIVGTMTLTLDSPAGLPLDKDYPDELNALRARGARLAEVNSLAVVGRCRHAGVTNLLNLAGWALTLRMLKATHLVFGCNPKVSEFYRATYNFNVMGAAKRHAQLVAPVAGLVCDMSEVYDFMQRAYPRPLATGVTYGEHMFGVLPPCVELPEGTHADLVRWKMPREVFQKLFLVESDRLETLDARTRSYLAQARTPTTISGYRPRLALAALG